MKFLYVGLLVGLLLSGCPAQHYSFSGQHAQAVSYASRANTKVLGCIRSGPFALLFCDLDNGWQIKCTEEGCLQHTNTR